LARRVREVVLAADHVAYAHLRVVDGGGEVVAGAPVGAQDDEVADDIAGEADAARMRSSTTISPRHGERSAAARRGETSLDLLPRQAVALRSYLGIRPAASRSSRSASRRSCEQKQR